MIDQYSFVLIKKLKVTDSLSYSSPELAKKHPDESGQVVFGSLWNECRDRTHVDNYIEKIFDNILKHI